MFGKTIIILTLSVSFGNASFFSFSKIASYAKYLYPENLTAEATGNELWSGILKDCRNKMTFSCIQKNAYFYLDNTLVEHDNITVFDGFTLTKNSLNYDSCRKNCQDDFQENLVENSSREDRSQKEEKTRLYEDKKTPLEEVTSALRDKTVKFLATRDYEIQLPDFFFENSKIKISPKEIDENGALVRIDFGQRGIENQGRLFKKLRKFIQNRLLMSFLALMLIIKLIKVKFMFVIPFLFGVGAAKKLFLKLLLFLVPAFAHVFKLCSSYYSSKYHHHHHHQIAHHHHHVPVPVPVPTYVDHPHPPHHFPHHEEEFNGYDYAHPHLQIRKDMEELKEWGIDAYTEPYDDSGLRPIAQAPPPPPPPRYPTASYGVPDVPQYPMIKPNLAPGVPPQSHVPQHSNVPSHGQILAYSGYLEDPKLHRRISVQAPAAPQPAKQNSVNGLISNQLKSTPHPVFVHNTQTQRAPQQIVQKSGQAPIAATNQVVHDDSFYGPIVQRLEDIFAQLRFVEEPCRERLICSMYKNPAIYSPHSNLVSNELSRDPQELKRTTTGSASSQRFLRYVNAARLGQEGGDCLRTYPCQINTE